MSNTAFVFIKPHANTEKARQVVKETMEAKGLKIQKEGLIDGAEIESKMLIDNHYYAIASKATLLKPHELNVPEKKFTEQFGGDWQTALKDGKVFNAMDACTHLGLNAEQLNTEWAKAKKAEKLVKFGGGFYCGLIDTVEGKEPIYVMNGFFMSMRSNFVAPGASIYFFVVEWSSKSLSWESFRGDLLGPTDPATAPDDSLRGAFFKNWESYGLAYQPNVGDNAVHASASPFEALAERMNWLGMNAESDAFGKEVLAVLGKETLDEWSKDPQVTYGYNPVKKSVFDSVEDTDAPYCLALLGMMQRQQSVEKMSALMNSAFVFIKPHANTEKARTTVQAELQSKGLKIEKEGLISGADIEAKQLIDNHYYAIASKATLLKPNELNVPEKMFADKFGGDWQTALKDGKVFNAKDACTHLGLDAEQLNTEWAKAKKAEKLVKFGGGFYCGLIATVEGKEPIYVMNGFFMSMRSNFVAPGASIYYYVVSWDPKELSWESFRGKLLGPTDPVTAPEDSLRGMFYKNWESYGLAYEPNVGDNAMHASASPFEALAEKMNWLEMPGDADAYGNAVLKVIGQDNLNEWSKDPQVTYGKIPIKKSVFDSLEDTDAGYCLSLLGMIENQASK